MIRRVHCEKKTKIYIPKTVKPKIISYKPQPENNAELNAQHSTGNSAESNPNFSA